MKRSNNVSDQALDDRDSTEKVYNISESPTTASSACSLPRFGWRNRRHGVAEGRIITSLAFEPSQSLGNEFDLDGKSLYRYEDDGGNVDAQKRGDAGDGQEEMEMGVSVWLGGQICRAHVARRCRGCLLLPTRNSF